ncbi:DUF3795 domain-containing protein [Patescibacteria group bacterium]
MKSNLIAPCGMNCNLCVAYLREKNRCPGCKKAGEKFHTSCTIKNCNKIKKICFCSNKCEKYPCRRLKILDKRYRTKYGMSMIENLMFIKKHGINKFLKQQGAEYVSEKGIFCVHDKKYHK